MIHPRRGHVTNLEEQSTVETRGSAVLRDPWSCTCLLVGVYTAVCEGWVVVAAERGGATRSKVRATARVFYPPNPGSKTRTPIYLSSERHPPSKIQRSPFSFSFSHLLFGLMLSSKRKYARLVPEASAFRTHHVQPGAGCRESWMTPTGSAGNNTRWQSIDDEVQRSRREYVVSTHSSCLRRLQVYDLHKVPSSARSSHSSSTHPRSRTKQKNTIPTEERLMLLAWWTGDRLSSRPVTPFLVFILTTCRCCCCCCSSCTPSLFSGAGQKARVE